MSLQANSPVVVVPTDPGVPTMARSIPTPGQSIEPGIGTSLRLSLGAFLPASVKKWIVLGATSSGVEIGCHLQRPLHRRAEWP
jgi:hypothetical protein